MLSMGVHRSHTECWSLVVRSRSRDITAQVLKCLAAATTDDSQLQLQPQDYDNFVNALPTTCAQQYQQVLGGLKAALKDIGERD